MITRDVIYKKFYRHLPRIIGMKQKVYSVLMPLLKRNGEFYFVLEKRSHGISQPGEISFPGGKKDFSDRDMMETSIRETVEELGISREDISVISAFNILAPPFNKVIYSYLAELRENCLFDINKKEVEEVIMIPLSYFLSNPPECYDGNVLVERPDSFPFDKIPLKQDYPFAKGNYCTCFYEYGNIVIWGLTATLIKSFIDTLQS